jgi:uncharacterized LabA/DUF88 family protein
VGDVTNDTYLFIDGEYVRQIHRAAMRDFFDVDGELDIDGAKHQAGAIRAFFYDSFDETPRQGESAEDCKLRLAPLEKFFSRTRDLSGVHVRLGTVAGKRRRQKEVDILLATDMLTHGFNGSMRKAVLVAGDLDFRPIVEALVRNGVLVEVWYHRSSVARDLPGAADFGREISFKDLHSWNTEAFKAEHRIPHEQWPGGAPYGEMVKIGSVDGHAVELRRHPVSAGPVQLSFWITVSPGETICVRDHDEKLIEKYVAAQHAPVQWEADAGELRITT